ncbi:diguanylate cyclase regulator RdcB family protein [Aeromonas veronii]|uniref:diguanylate cyclase regulator RdcB family protein n=1 Tax=Aeromonas veronii TaxID=654 RepID=UPI0024446D36|nr:diguanylate cyclase regulator RdcB family protein [Aeromonas veronii]
MTMCVSKQIDPFFRRIKEGFNGRSSQRQQAINASLLDGVEASLNWLTELTSSLATTNYALAQVNDRVSSLMQDTATIAHYSADTREQLSMLAMQVNKQLHHLEQRLRSVDRLQRGQLHLEQIFSTWKAGRYSLLPLAGRCYVALEELRWGGIW